MAVVAWDAPFDKKTLKCSNGVTGLDRVIVISMHSDVAVSQDQCFVFAERMYSKG